VRALLFVTIAALGCVLGCSQAPESDPGKSTEKPAAVSQGDKTAPAGQADTTSTNQWQTTVSGLKYTVLKHGTGTVSPKATDTVKVHYHGTLLNGTIFDSSVQRGEPISFPLNGVIRGWTEGLQLMKVGDKFKFEIPPDLAYGQDGRPPVIPPNSTLVFEVELLEIQ
jgi:FKBP-type peptidyl-prolyl cis-trans isomerase